MNLSKLYDEYAGKRVKAEMTDGEVIRGVLSCYISAEDNDPDPESIVIDNIELPVNEIENVDIEK